MARSKLRHFKFAACWRITAGRLVSCSIFAFFITVSCAQKTETPEYTAVVGDIQYDPAVDDPGFKVCNVEQVLQYYQFGKGMQFRGEKGSIIKYFNSKFKGEEIKGESGYITIRFVVNCEGNTGRFRMQEMDVDYQPKQFTKSISSRLLELTRDLHGWTIGTYDNVSYDYYQYLTFKIEDGIIKEILP
jgi:hypothetical protein